MTSYYNEGLRRHHDSEVAGPEHASVGTSHLICEVGRTRQASIATPPGASVGTSKCLSHKDLGAISASGADRNAVRGAHYRERGRHARASELQGGPLGRHLGPETGLSARYTRT